jgi:lipopolysaccharide/colanic/teichoic acid biosynthesis glycosyltransferase
VSEIAVEHSQQTSRLAVGPVNAASRSALLVKRIFDLAGATAALLVLTPLLCLIAVLVRVSSPGPVIYRRRVLGVEGFQFDAFKFRTMVQDADRIWQSDNDLARRFKENMKLRTDPRVTAIGRVLRRLSLDELPQLFNVIRGEMSLVGPRMIAPEEANRYGGALTRRLSVRPGITGLWQVSGRQNVDYNTRIALDLEYIENWSLWLDLVILLKTIPVVLSMRGAY